MLPCFNHRAIITIKKSDPEMSMNRFEWWCISTVDRIQLERIGIQNVERFKINSEYEFDSRDNSIKAFNITVTGITKKEVLSICCQASTINELKVTTFYS